MHRSLRSPVVPCLSVSLLIGTASFSFAEQLANDGISPQATFRYLRTHFQHLRIHFKPDFSKQNPERHLIGECLPDYYMCNPCPVHEIGTCCTNDQKCKCVENTPACE
jgi:hypothetical protein